MKNHKNLTLEALRGIASLYVAVGHWVLSIPEIHPVLKFIFSFGQEAVIIFFIVSGYVIHTSWNSQKAQTLKTYFIKRFRRIYFPFLVSIILSIIILPLSTFSWKELFGNLLMLQDFSHGKPGVFVESFMGNAPLWSLSYEWGFYCVFPFIYLLLKKRNVADKFVAYFGFLSMLIYIIFPNHLLLIPAYLIIWWSGLKLSEYSHEPTDTRKVLKDISFLFAPIIIILLVTCLYWKYNYHTLQLGTYPILFLRHFIFAFIFAFITLTGGRLKYYIRKIILPFRILAPISYGIYIFHYAIFVQLKTGVIWYIDIPLKIVLVLSLSYVVEIKLQPIVNRYIS